MSVGVESGYHEKQRHACIKEENISVEILPVPEEQPGKNGRNIDEPEKIRNDKIFTKWNIVIQRKMDHMVGQAGTVFQPDEPRDINRKIQNGPRMGIFF